MKNPLRLLASRLSNHPLIAVAVLAMAVIAVVVLPSGTPWAQEVSNDRSTTRSDTVRLNPAHLNPSIEKLAAGKPIFGIQTSDMSRDSARAIGNLDTDLVYVDMEHSPMNFDGLANFVASMGNKAYTLKKGNAQPKSAVIARFPPYGFEHSAWVVKQALDIGLMGFLFNGIETKEDAEFAVKSMRYPPWKTNPHTQEGPRGLRGWSPTGALWVWGISADEYRRRADVWPLNPEGDLMSVLSIESAEGVDNIEAIASVPGISVLHAAAGGDLSASYGVPNNTPPVEAGRQKILKACLAHHIVCSIHVHGKAEIDRRLKEGWTMIITESGTPNE
jgi:4-hydroxy-2-oxoheptanedioate aldolase